MDSAVGRVLLLHCACLRAKNLLLFDIDLGKVEAAGTRQDSTFAFWLRNSAQWLSQRE